MYKLRVKYAKQGDIRFISHLDIVNLFGRAIRRASIPIVYSGGYNPRPKIDFSFALALGMESICEYADFILLEKIMETEFIQRFSGALPDCLRILSADYVPLSFASLTSSLNIAAYKIIPDKKLDFNFLQENINVFSNNSEKTIFHKSKKGTIKMDTNDIIREIRCCIEDDVVFIIMIMNISPQKNIKPQEVMSSILNIGINDMLGWSFIRTELS